ncbi:MAG: hypothetical protein OXM55_04120, partial [Bdellovibrionales bacterium]|nr:hypothetical protein [Bdellovibrionales bacterium]
MSKFTISPADEIWALIKETQRNLERFSVEAERQRAEEKKQQAERWVEAEKQRAEEKKQQAVQRAEAEKRQAEAEKR